MWKDVTFNSLMEKCDNQKYTQGTFLEVWIQPPNLIKPTQHQTENDHQRDQSQTLFFFGFPFGWFSCCQADKLVIEQESKRRAAREKRADEGELIILQSKGCFFFFIIIIHPQLKKPVKLTERDERQLCLFVLFLPFFLSSFLSFFLSSFLSFFLSSLSFSGSVFSLCQGTRLAVSEWVSEWLSWEKHQYQFIHTITHIEQHHTDTHTEFSLHSAAHRTTLWPLEKCWHVITGGEETTVDLALASKSLFLKH